MESSRSAFPEILHWCATTVLVGAPISAFFKKLAEKLGEDAGVATSAGIKWLYATICNRLRNRRGELAIQRSSGIKLIVDQDLPTEAWVALDRIFMSEVKNGTPHWALTQWKFINWRGNYFSAHAANYRAVLILQLVLAYVTPTERSFGVLRLV